MMISWFRAARSNQHDVLFVQDARVTSSNCHSAVTDQTLCSLLINSFMGGTRAYQEANTFTSMPRCMNDKENKVSKVRLNPLVWKRSGVFHIQSQACSRMNVPPQQWYISVYRSVSHSRNKKVFTEPDCQCRVTCLDFRPQLQILTHLRTKLQFIYKEVSPSA